MLNLSKPQRLIYEMEKYAGGSIASICGSVLVQGQRDVSELQRTASEIYRLNEALRIRITERNGEIWQDVTNYEEQPVEVLHFASKEAFTDYAEDYAKTTIPLSGPLCKIQVILLPDSYGLLAKLHHIIGDAWTLTLIASQFNEILAGREPQAFPYSNYIEREMSYTQSLRYLKDRDFFLEQYEACREVTYLSEKTGDSYTASRRTFFIETEKAEQIREYARNHSTSPFVLFLMAFSIYFSRIKMNTEQFYIGTPILNRGNFKEKNTMGMFINTAPVPAHVDYARSFAENLASMQGTVFSVLRHQKFHYGDMLSAIRQRFGPVETLYDVILSYQNATVTGAEQNVETAWYHNGSQTESLQIHFDERDSKGFFRIRCDYRMDKLTETDVQKIYEHILNLLFDAIDYDTKCPAELAMLFPDEEQQLLRDFNKTAVAYPREKCIHTLFEEQVKRTPEQNAVIACDRTLTYQELNEQANQIAHGLINLGVKPGGIVAFALPRRSYLIAVMFGILKAGAAYLPVDPDYPQDRINYMLEDSKAAYFITELNVHELLTNESIVNPEISVNSNNLCYCIYTSGSTGKPKGTLLTHQNVGNYVSNNKYNVVYSVIHDSWKTIMSVTTVGFDIFVTESILPLINGMTVLFANEDQSQMQTALNEFIKQYPADVLQTTPTKMRLLIGEPTQREYLKSLKSIILGGEAVDAALVSELGMLTSAHIFNIYGPTETTVWSTIAEIQSADDITIGKPIANTQIHIVDKYLQPVPIGVTGELCIAGDGVGAGYLNRPELTSEKFIDNPFGTGKLYKTGDLAYWREDGNIAYIGRNDFQVKIRGLRIELGEIENAIQEVEGISQAAVVVRKNEAGRQLICAFYTGQEIESKTFRAALGQKLPKYMLPHSFTHLEAIPLTSSGKVNRKALPEVSPDCIADMVEYTAPITEQETVLCTAVQDVLHIEKVGMADNFFDLGGDSLKSIEVIAALEQAGYSTEVKTIFDTDTLGELAERLTASEAGQEIAIPTGPIRATDAQMRVYTAQAMAGGTAYNIPYVFRVKRLDPAKLQTAISILVNRHESLRTRFENRDGQIMQIVEDSVSCAVESLDSGDISAFVRPFDLETAPLLRVGYYQNTVMVDMHHIIADGSSVSIFLRELNELYMGRILSRKPAQYREFAVRNYDHAQSGQYWRTVFSDEPPVLEMNTDHPRQSKQTFSGASLYVELPGTLHTQICDKCRAENITPYAFYIGAFYILLSKFSGSEDIVVGIPTSGRSGKFLNTIGMFVNTLALRNRPEGFKTVSAFLREVRDITVHAMNSQEFSYGELLKELNIHTENRNPLFDVMFAYQNEQMADVVFGDEPAELLPVPITTSKYDITLNLLPSQENVILMVEYCTDLYEERTIQRLLDGFRIVIIQMLDSGKQIRNITALTHDERQLLLHGFNNIKKEYTGEKYIHTLFEEQTIKTPNKEAVIASDCTLTYRELNEQANRIAHGLICQGVKPGDIIAFSLPRKSYLIAAMFGILKAGAAYLPIDSDYPQDRINYMLEDSKATYFITESNVHELLTNKSIVNPEVSIDSNSRCYCIYTSGSTGKPKGSLLRHRGIVNLVTDLNIYHDLSKCNRIGFMTTITFDVAAQEIFTALLNGFTGVLVAERKETKIDIIIDSIQANNIDVIYATPTYFDALTDNEEKANKILSSVKVICLAGEKFYLNRCVLSLRSQYPIIFENQYGPAETHVATAAMIENYFDITIGKPIANTQIYIVDKYLHLVPIGVVGELCIAGDGLGAGYLNSPELTSEKFINNPFGTGKLYMTGDLSFWREDGNIVYVGRNDFQVKIRGLRIELGEIENAIQEVEGVSQTAVVVRKNEAGRQLICAFYTGQEIDSRIFRAALGQKLPKYMLPHSFTHVEAMPLTRSGKVNRKALPEINLNYISDVVEYVSPETEQEIVLCTAVQDVLHIEKVGMADNFFDLGGDSLKSIELIAVLEQNGYSTEVRTIFDADTLGKLAERLTAAKTEQEIAIPTGPIPATDAQMRIYTAQAMAGGTAYNVPYAFRVKQLDPARLQVAVSKLVERHESLRTRFENLNGQIMQIVENTGGCVIEALDNGNISAFVRPFDLETAPLLRVGYYQNTVMVDMHHIITDGYSMPIFLRELNDLYMGRKPNGEPALYREFTMRNYDYTKSEQYWLSVFSDEPPVLEMNTDYPRQSRRTFSGAAIYKEFPYELHSRICVKCRAENITAHDFYIGAFYILLSKISGNDDIVIGIPASGRSGRFLNTIGMFVNTLALRSRPEGSKTVSSFLWEVRNATVQAMNNQEYPYGKLVKALGIHTKNRNPLFDVIFAYHSEEMTNVIFGDKPAELLPVPNSTSKCDITFNIVPREKNIIVVAEYCVKLYKEQTIQRLLKEYRQILFQMLDNGKLLRDISVLTDSEKQQILYGFNDTASDYPRSKCVHTLFEEQTIKTPHKAAVIACDRTLTYRELNEQANQIAYNLIECGVRPGDIVAFALPRRSYLIATMFGILKAGAAYLPIDPDYPRDRIDYMLEDSKASYFILETNIQNLMKAKSITNPTIPLTSDNLCYCIYTSGSTGKPKGTILTHKNVGNYVNNTKKNHVVHDLIRESCNVFVSVTTVSFDIFVTESILPLVNGMTVLFANEDQSKVQTALNKFLKQNPADVLQTTPTKMRILIGEPTQCEYLKSLRVIILGGEVVDAALISDLSQLTSARVFNIYGPTETTVWSSNTEIQSPDNITIGKPIANTQIYIVDKYLHPVPIGVTGELCIAGDGVGAGYLNRPELTAEKFIDNPFGAGSLYRTGDLAYWREDGNIVYVGRNDFQVKIRGLRIELGEIENAIQEVEGVSQATVVVRKNEEGRQLICAFYTGQEIDSKAFRTAIEQKLPKYMLPHSFTHLEAMPLTSSGKVNRKTLPEVDLCSIANAVEYVPPVGEIEMRLASLMEQVLDYSPIGRDDDFFDLGGDSLKAIEFLSMAHSEGIYFSLQSLFDHPTVNTLRTSMEDGDSLNISYDPIEFTGINRLLAKNREASAHTPSKKAVGNLLLAGATGFLGIHILEDFLRFDTGTAYCLVRGEDKTASEKRLAELMEFYFGDMYRDLLGKRIQVICGDLGEDSFGLSEHTYHELLECVDTVINAAACVKHYGSYQYFYEVNVESTKRLIAFCQTGHAKLIHISTLSVSGNSFDTFDGYVSETEKHFDEGDLYIEQQLKNVYARSKFEAEKIVLEAMLDGLHANIMRMGNLTNRFSDGKFQINYESNASAKRVKGMIELGAIPDYLIAENMYMEFTPIDEAARAVMTIVRHFSSEQTVFHINSTKVVYMDKLLEYVNKLGYPLKAVSGTEFAAALRNTAKEAGREHILQIFINDLDENDRLNYDSNIRIEENITENYLKQLGFEWSEVGLEYLRRYTEYFRQIGYWKV